MASRASAATPVTQSAPSRAHARARDLSLAFNSSKRRRNSSSVGGSMGRAAWMVAHGRSCSSSALDGTKPFPGFSSGRLSVNGVRRGRSSLSVFKTSCHMRSDKAIRATMRMGLGTRFIQRSSDTSPSWKRILSPVSVDSGRAPAPRREMCGVPANRTQPDTQVRSAAYAAGRAMFPSRRLESLPGSRPHVRFEYCFSHSAWAMRRALSPRLSVHKGRPSALWSSMRGASNRPPALPPTKIPHPSLR